ncbi:MAG TPA: M6 family metalloprotease domain-containing protein [Verrucomicrobiae bacterium]|nr:M6 family metalloprotease domain-containing protein [Verrucomicrobiae bacterium]
MIRYWWPGLCRTDLAWLFLGLATWWGLGSAQQALAVPANPEAWEVRQPDGVTFRMRLRGDEFFSWHETEDGYAIIKDPTDGYWKFARPAADKAEFRAIPAARIGTAEPARLGIRKHDLPNRRLLHEQIQKARQQLGVEPAAASASVPDSSQVQLELPKPPMPVSGTKTAKNIVILACFLDHWDAVNSTVSSGFGLVDTNQYYNLFNQISYSTDGAAGSVKDYYKEVSYGKLALESVVTPWVELPREEAYYGTGHPDANPKQMVADAIAAAADAGFDFSQGDMDGDGWVDCLTVVHSGYDQAASGAPDASIWSHRGSLSSVATNNGVKMYRYQTDAALRGSSGSNIVRIGTPCHELGHFFGLPDLYDYSALTKGLGNWCLMSGASWNGSSGNRPGHLSAWCKTFLGFARPVQIHSKTGILLPCAEDNPIVGMLRDGVSNGEYFLIENRAKVGFDNASQIYPGMIIYHVDGKSLNNDLGTWPHPAVKIEEADGDDSLGAKTNASEAGDVWTGTGGLSGGFRDQTGNSNTSAMLYQAGAFYSRTNDAASYTYNALDNFSDAGSNMTLNATTFRPSAPTGYALPLEYTLAWRAASAATKYEVQEGSLATLTDFSDGAEDEDAMYANWYVGGMVRRMATNASHLGSYSYAMQNADAPVHHLIMRKPFKVTTGTAISFYVKSHISTDNGYLNCEISNDDGDTWHALGTYNGYIDTWSLRTYDYSAITAAGIGDGDQCIIRFVADIEYASGWTSYPSRGFAVDDISITGTQIAGYGNWTSLDSNVATNSYVISGRTNGVYAYRIQAYANGAWRGFGPEGEITVSGTNHPPTFTSPNVADARVGTAYGGSLAGAAMDPDMNDVLTYSKLSGPAWLSVAADGATSGMPLPGDVGSNTFTVRVADSGGNYADATITIWVDLPLSALRSNLVAYLPFDSDFLDYSGRGNHPAQSNINSRATGRLGAGYVLTNSAFLSFGLSPDLHFKNDSSGNSNSFSVVFWAKIPPGSYSGEPIFAANKDWSQNTNTGWALASGPGTSSSGFFQMNFKESNANSRDYDSTRASLTNGWHHFAVVFQREGTRTCFAYIDGVQATNLAMYPSGVNIDGDNLPVNIARDGTGAGTRGSWTTGTAMMDDFAFWRRALSSNDIAIMYAAATNGFGLPYAGVAPVITNLSANFFLPCGGSSNLSVDVLSPAAVSYQWRLGGTPISAATNSSCVFTNGGPPGTALYDVVINNAYGATTSQVISVTLGAPPSVALTSPTGGQVFAAPATINLVANVASNGTMIDKVRFLCATSNLIGEVLTPPYVSTWSNVSPGAYSLNARLFYNGGNITESVPVSVSVVTPFAYWQIQYFGSTNNPAAAPEVDTFGTGQNNEFKFVAGLDPTNAAAVFCLDIATVPGQPQQKKLTFSPRWTDRDYAPQFSTNLSNGAGWMALTNINVSDVGAERTVIDRNAVELNKFYRIEITRP